MCVIVILSFSPPNQRKKRPAQIVSQNSIDILSDDDGYDG
jgi:hypothetical protein